MSTHRGCSSVSVAAVHHASRPSRRAAAGKDVPTLRYKVANRIPYARGLGSSSAAIIAGIIAGLVLAGHTLPCWGSEALLQIAAEIEVSDR